uniref:Uncharacterized protein n=1 Tax=Aegilops tauschii subsp. strangulata TaxID=200361 RepID=A0A453Q4W1_AEGTS
AGILCMVRHVLVTYHVCVSVDRYRELRGEGESAGKRKRRGKIRGEGSKKMDFKF